MKWVYVAGDLQFSMQLAGRAIVIRETSQSDWNKILLGGPGITATVKYQK